MSTERDFRFYDGPESDEMLAAFDAYLLATASNRNRPQLRNALGYDEEEWVGFKAAWSVCMADRALRPEGQAGLMADAHWPVLSATAIVPTCAQCGLSILHPSHKRTSDHQTGLTVEGARTEGKTRKRVSAPKGEGS